MAFILFSLSRICSTLCGTMLLRPWGASFLLPSSELFPSGFGVFVLGAMRLHCLVTPSLFCGSQYPIWNRSSITAPLPMSHYWNQIITIPFLNWYANSTFMTTLSCEINVSRRDFLECLSDKINFVNFHRKLKYIEVKRFFTSKLTVVTVFGKILLARSVAKSDEFLAPYFGVEFVFIIFCGNLRSCFYYITLCLSEGRWKPRISSVSHALFIFVSDTSSTNAGKDRVQGTMDSSGWFLFDTRMDNWTDKGKGQPGYEEEWNLELVMFIMIRFQ